jgi:hypothetical protein
MTMEAEERVKQDIPGVVVIPLFQYCDGDRRRTMYVNGKRLRRLS